MLSETLSHRGVVGCYGGHLHQIKMSLVTCGVILIASQKVDGGL